MWNGFLLNQKTSFASRELFAILLVMRKLSLLLILVSLFICNISFAKSAAYEEARRCYYTQAKAKHSSSRTWDKCIKKFKQSAEGKDAEAGTYSVARLNREAFEKFGDDKYKENAVKYYNEVVKKYPKGYLASGALYQIGCMREEVYNDNAKAMRAFSYLVNTYPNSKHASLAEKKLATLKVESKSLKKKGNAGQVQINQKKIAIKGGYAGPRTPAKLVWEKDVKNKSSSFKFHLDRKTHYIYYKEAKGVRTNTPAKLIIEFPYTKLADNAPKEIEFKSGGISKMKVKESLFNNRLKVTFYLREGSDYTVKESGYDVVASIGAVAGASKAMVVAKKSKKSQKKKRPVRIMIDPGHGGEDLGAVGLKGTQEKKVTLAVAKQVAKFLKKNMNAKVKFTRTRDKYIDLEKRNRMAEKWKADIFISLHVNASPDRTRAGIETYYLNNTTNKASIKLAKRENKYSSRNLKNVEKIVLTMMQNYNAEESKGLARDIQGSLVDRMSKEYPGVRDRNVKGALFYVLVGAKCPGALVEMSFISNPKEERRLKNKAYQSQLAMGVAEGIEQYLKAHPPE